MIVFRGGFDESKGWSFILGNVFQVVDYMIHRGGGAIHKDFFDRWDRTLIADMDRVCVEKACSMSEAFIGVALCCSSECWRLQYALGY